MHKQIYALEFILLLLTCGYQLSNCQIQMTAASSYISGNGSGWQDWEDGVQVRATSLNGNSGNLIYDTEFRDRGFGVSGGRWDQIDYYETPNERAESIEIQFDGSVQNLIVTVGMMGFNEGGQGCSETGRWEAYDNQGSPIGQGLLGPELSNLGVNQKIGNSYGLYPIPININGIGSLKIFATGFGHGTCPFTTRNYGENNSDFNINAISYVRSGGNSNTSPIARNDGSYEVNLNETLSILISDLLSNDEDPDGDAITLSEVSDPQNGNVAMTGNQINFTPSIEGIGRFSYSITDGKGRFATANVGIIISDPNPDPDPINYEGIFAIVSKMNESLSLKVNSLGNRSSVISEDCAIDAHTWNISIRENGYYEIINIPSTRAMEGWTSSPKDGDDVTIYADNNRDWQRWSISNAGNGYIKLQGKYNPRYVTLENGNAILRNETNNDNQLWKLVPANSMNCNTNNAPIANNDGLFNINYNPGEFTISTSTLLSNDNDPDGDDVVVESVQNATNATVRFISEDVIGFTPDTDYRGEAQFEYTISDGNGGTASALVSFCIGNRSPIARNNGVYEMVDGTTLVISIAELLSNDEDPDNDPLTIYEVSDPQNGVATITGNNIEFVAAGPGTGRFSYTITDGKGRFATANVGILISEADPNNAPEANDDGPISLSSSTIHYIPFDTFLSNDTDPDNDLLTIINVSNSVGGSVLILGNEINFRPIQGFNGSGSFEYEISDGRGGTDIATVFINLSPENTNPIANDDGPIIIRSGELYKFDNAFLLDNDTDADGDQLSIITVGNNVNGAVGFSGSDVIFTSIPDYVGPASFVYTISDGNGGTDQATVTLVVESSDSGNLTNYTINGNSLSTNNEANNTNWDECVTVSTRAYDGSIAGIGKRSIARGTSGGRYGYQIDYDAITDRSEQFIIHFNREVESVAFELRHLEDSEWQGLNETGTWTALDASGDVIDEGLIDPDLGNYQSRGIYDFNLSPELKMHTMVIQATAYNHGEGTGRTNNNSDFAIAELEFASAAGCPNTVNGNISQSRSFNKEAVIKVKTFPNPSSDMITLDIQGMDASIPTNIQIVNSTGKLVNYRAINPEVNQRIDIRAYENGQYWLYVRNGENQITTTFQKIK